MRERCVDPGNDPGRDEYGLPPLDVEIPDDARDLDHDVQAYHRELRAQRRRMRARRLLGPLTRHGMVIPLVAACLALTLLTGTLLTALSTRQVPLPRGGGPSAPALRASSPSGRGPGQQPAVPDVRVILDGKRVSLRTLVPAVLAWVPTPCAAACRTILRRLARQATQAGVKIYFVGTGRAEEELPALVSRDAGARYARRVAKDTTDALRVYGPVGVTAILAHRDDSVASADVLRNVQSRLPQQFKVRLHVLANAGPGTATGSSAPAQQPAPQAS